MNQKVLVRQLLREIKEMSLVCESLSEVDEIPSALLLLSKSKVTSMSELIDLLLPCADGKNERGVDEGKNNRAQEQNIDAIEEAVASEKENQVEEKIGSCDENGSESKEKVFAYEQSHTHTELKKEQECFEGNAPIGNEDCLSEIKKEERQEEKKEADSVYESKETVKLKDDLNAPGDLNTTETNFGEREKEIDLPQNKDVTKELLQETRQDEIPFEKRQTVFQESKESVAKEKEQEKKDTSYNGNSKVASVSSKADRSNVLHEKAGFKVGFYENRNAESRFVKSLKISVGDRFLYQKNLFNGDIKLMNRTIAELDQLHSLKEAMEYISKFSWDEGNEAVESFHTLLKSRFS